MKTIVRQSTFETNSSSAHTFVITNENINPNDDFEEFKEKHTVTREDGKKFLYLNQMVFSREFAVLDETQEKMSYIIASYSWNYSKLIDDIIPALLTKLPGYSGIALREEEDCFPYDSSYNTRHDIFSLDSVGPLATGSVDSQSNDTLDEALSAMQKLPEYQGYSIGELCLEIIFNPTIVIVTGDDGDIDLEALAAGGFLNKRVKGILSTTYLGDSFNEHVSYFKKPEAFYKKEYSYIDEVPDYE